MGKFAALTCPNVTRAVTIHPAEAGQIGRKFYLEPNGATSITPP